MPKALLVATYALAMAAFWPSAPDHTVEESWSPYAAVHLAQGLSGVAGLCTIGLMVTVYGLAPGAR